MGMLHRMVAVGSLLLTLPAGQSAWADVRNMPAGQKSLEFVTVGDAGNPVNPISGRGAVDYTYRIGKYDVTASQYCQFLNAVASQVDTHGLYNLNMANTGFGAGGCGITRTAQAGGYTYNVVPGRENYPVNYVSWVDAARFANWLANGQPAGLQRTGTTETGTYTLEGATSDEDLMAVSRNPHATYAIPTEEEWYKAAYYKGGSTDAGYWYYPTRSNTAPSNVLSSTGSNNANYAVWNSSANVFTYSDPMNCLTPVGAFAGSPGPYGTFDQGGNVAQWLEASAMWPASFLRKGIGGGSFSHLDRQGLTADAWGSTVLQKETYTMGFRVALVPEPVTLSLLTVGGLLMAVRRR